ncbi:Pentatricopeptide repeat (PPR) superfamily protein [Melia azedarach]|uniref:Pentatricopeptide repeat (PPR) superfamily protein n=1 Tax=Melia azedarach TaxID=155640 RepID=A0ACC1X3A7_MELAZ|nr:Pentatricopeptide repeat (PPR) superfamily protein [Melia azedarach]
MMMMESTMAVRFPAGTNFCSSAALSHNRSICNAEDVTGVNITSRRLFQSGCSNVSWNRFRRLNGKSLIRRSNLIKNRIRASASDPVRRNGKTRYHPSEDIADSTLDNGLDARLTAAETTRTIIEVNSKATLMFTDFINDGIHENIIWPDLPYVTDEHGNIYFQVRNEEDILQSLTSENNFVQVIIGFDIAEMLKEMELSGPSDIDFGIDEIEDEDSDVEDDEEDEDEEDEEDDENWVNVLEAEEDIDDEDEDVGDWAKLETMRSSHPMYFAKKLAEVASDDPIDWMEQPPAGLAIQGLLRPALIEEHSDIQRHISGNQSRAADISGNAVENKQEDLHIINGHRHESETSSNDSSYAEKSKKDDMPINGTSFYKLEMIKIQLILAHAHQAVVDVEDFRKAQPDAIAHSAAKIISRLKAGGEKTTQALKSLCWRSKGIQAEEAALIGVDSLGFDLRVCSGTQIQTLRFSFNTRATSEYSAERQLNDLLFPRIHQKSQKKKQTYQNEY